MLTLAHAMCVNASHIDHTDMLRAGGTAGVLGHRVMAPSTIGTFLRSFTHGHVQQLDAIGGDLLAGLTARVPGVIAGAQDLQGFACIDVDDTIREVHGYAKQGAGYGYNGVKGLNSLLGTVCTPVAAPLICGARLRGGKTGSARGAARFVASCLRTATAAGAGAGCPREPAGHGGWQPALTTRRAPEKCCRRPVGPNDGRRRCSARSVE